LSPEQIGQLVHQAFGQKYLRDKELELETVVHTFIVLLKEKRWQVLTDQTPSWTAFTSAGTTM
jgi:hypothetical protein